jgi:cysteine desulfurase
MPDNLTYMDHSATSPLDPEVLEAITPYFSDEFGNASTLYGLGRAAQEALESARDKVAIALGAEPGEIVFTSGGTESDNLAIKGVALAREEMKGHIITTSIEHPAVLEACRYLEDIGFEVTYLPVNEYGQVELDTLQEAMQKDTFLVSVGFANHEIGTIQDIAEIAKLVHDHGALFHTDAVQAVTKIDTNVRYHDIDLLSLSAHKFYGPKGAGALFVRKGVRLTPLLHGGGHERKLRSGTENIPGLVGLAKAIELGIQRMPADMPRVRGMRDRLISDIMANIDNAYLNGHPEKRLPHNAHFRFSFIEGEAIILNLDYMGIAAATGSACSTRTLKASHVLLAIGLRPEEAHGSLRLTLGRINTDEDVDRVLETVPAVVEKLRKMSPLGKEPR